MNFKELAAQDIGRTFFNTDEFSEEVMIDGRPLVVNIDSERLIERAEKEYSGITHGLVLYYVAALIFGLPTPKVGNSQKFNNKLYYIDSIAENEGVYEILINQNRGE